MMSLSQGWSDPDAGPRRRSGAGRAENVYDDGCLRVEHDSYYVVCKGSRVTFTRAEFLLLSRLTLNAERVVEAGELWRHVWGESKPYNAESLHVHMYRVRRPLEPFGIRVESLVNVGYRLSLAACCPNHR